MTTEYSDYYAECSARYDELRLDRDEEIAATATVLGDALGCPCALLEIGCGTGRYGSALRALGCRVTGLDASLAQVERAKARLASAVCATATSIPFADQSFDACLAVLMLHQIAREQLPVLLAEVYRILRGRGTLGIKTCSHLDLSTRWVENYFPSAARVNLQRYPSIERLRDELAAAGFLVESVIPTLTVLSISTRELLVAVVERHNTTLRMIPPDEFDAGLLELRSDLAERERVDVPQAHTHIVCRANKTY